jgi:hypothetical protein
MLKHGLRQFSSYQKVHFQSITDGIDTKTPPGRFFRVKYSTGYAATM